MVQRNQSGEGEKVKRCKEGRKETVQLRHKKRGGVLKVEPCSKAALLDKSCKEGPSPAIS